MKSHVAIIGSDDSAGLVKQFRHELQLRQIASLLSPPAAPREVLRWVMDLEPTQCALCIFADTDGRLTASLATALHPAITAVAWCPPPAEPGRLATILEDTPALICFASDPNILAHLVGNLLNSVQNSSSPSSPFAKTNPAKTSANIEQITSKNTDPPIAPADQDEQDIALYQELETAMAAPIKKVVKTEPVQVQKPALDFSVPLRSLMTHGQKLARSRSHLEVVGAHYFAALDEPWLSAFAHAGLDPVLLKDYLSGFDGGEEITSDPVISDEVFEAVSYAKKRARSSDTACVRVSDFLHGLLQNSDGSISDLLEAGDPSVEVLLNALDGMDNQNETCADPFFKPSSLDQASFYQFDSTEVRDIEKRLRDLPGFQKAAERVAESKVNQGATVGVTTVPVVPTPVTAEPPDKPELLKIAGEFPSVDVIEHVADRLLEGQIVAFPSDIMFALAADAANPAAVERLRQAAGMPQDKALSILIHSTSQLKHLVKADLDALEPLLDELWPGPLTLVFNAAGNLRRHVSHSATIAVRQPSDNTSLAILSMLGRPLAITSWEKPREQLTGQAAIIVDGDGLPQSVRTTVVDMTQNPWQVLREGAVPGQSVLRFYS